MEEYMPVVFSPPRDGRLLPKPVAIVDPWDKPVADHEDSCCSNSREGFVVSDKKMEGSDGCSCCLGERIETGGV